MKSTNKKLLINVRVSRYDDKLKDIINSKSVIQTVFLLINMFVFFFLIPLTHSPSWNFKTLTNI
jgi:hypothetical protein